MTLVLQTLGDFKQWRDGLSSLSIGFVPTMGALHAGHEALFARARAENETVIVSIFVNPTQFNDPKDFASYPNSFKADLDIAQKHGVDAVFLPSREMMYPDDYRFVVTERAFSAELCGKDRPGHFDGVLSIVLKLFNLTRPKRAYFGEKDYQQLSLVRDMAAAFFLPLEIVPVATVREADGLAMSSRNVRLKAADRARAAMLFRALSEQTSAQATSSWLNAQDIEVDYVADIADRRYGAVRFYDEAGASIRLIDNVKV